MSMTHVCSHNSSHSSDSNSNNDCITRSTIISTLTIIAICITSKSKMSDGNTAKTGSNNHADRHHQTHALLKR